MPQYHVIWEIDLEAESSEDAALQALGIHRDPESTATVFSVEHQGIRTVIDVEHNDPIILRDERPVPC